MNDFNGFQTCLLGLGKDMLSFIINSEVKNVHLVTDNVAETQSKILEERNIKLCETVPDTTSFIIRSPGYPKYGQLYSHISMSTPADLWVSKNVHRKIIAVTGTKGKSSVSHMIHHITGFPLGGNYAPTWDIPEGNSPVVLEISSYQAADWRNNVDYAVMVTLEEDHVTWHGNVKQYHADKMKLMKSAFKTVAGKTVPFFEHTNDIHSKKLREHVESHAEYMQDNMMLAVHICKHYGFSETHILESLLTLPQLPYRLNTIGVNSKGTWIDDSLASNPYAASKALGGLKGDVHMLIGGEDRKVDWKPLIGVLGRYEGKVVVWLIHDNNVQIHEKIREVDIEVRYAKNLEEACSKIPYDSDQTILFSPACPSPGDSTYVERSMIFQKAYKSFDNLDFRMKVG